MKVVIGRRSQFPFNIRMFDDGNGGGTGEGNGSGQGGGSGAGNAGGTGAGAGGAGAGAGSSGGGGQQQPFITFPDEASFMSRVGREAKKQFGDLLKGLGFEKEDDLKSIITTHNANIAAGKTELEKAQEAARLADEARVQAISTANNTLRTAEAKLQAAAMGIKPERVDYALKLANISDVEVKDGVVDNSAIKAALDAVLKDLPELKGTTMPPSGGGDFGGGGNGGGGGKAPLTWDYLRTISTGEAEERMEEINAFLAKNKR